MAAHAPISGSELRRLLLDAGLTVRATAAVLRVTPPTIRRHCRAHGIVLNRGPGPRSVLPQVDEIIRRIEAGETAQAIAQAHELQRPAVVSKLLRAGYRLHGGKVTRLEVSK